MFAVMNLAKDLAMRIAVNHFIATVMVDESNVKISHDKWVSIKDGFLKDVISKTKEITAIHQAVKDKDFDIIFSKVIAHIESKFVSPPPKPIEEEIRVSQGNVLDLCEDIMIAKNIWQKAHNEIAFAEWAFCHQFSINEGGENLQDNDGLTDLLNAIRSTLHTFEFKSRLIEKPAVDVPPISALKFQFEESDLSMLRQFRNPSNDPDSPRMESGTLKLKAKSAFIEVPLKTLFDAHVTGFAFHETWTDTIVWSLIQDMLFSEINERYDTSRLSSLQSWSYGRNYTTSPELLPERFFYNHRDAIPYIKNHVFKRGEALKKELDLDNDSDMTSLEVIFYKIFGGDISFRDFLVLLTALMFWGNEQYVGAESYKPFFNFDYNSFEEYVNGVMNIGSFIDYDALDELEQTCVNDIIGYTSLRESDDIKSLKEEVKLLKRGTLSSIVSKALSFYKDKIIEDNIWLGTSQKYDSPKNRDPKFHTCAYNRCSSLMRYLFSTQSGFSHHSLPDLVLAVVLDPIGAIGLESALNRNVIDNCISQMLNGFNVYLMVEFLEGPSCSFNDSGKMYSASIAGSLVPSAIRSARLYLPSGDDKVMIPDIVFESCGIKLQDRGIGGFTDTYCAGDEEYFVLQMIDLVCRHPGFRQSTVHRASSWLETRVSRRPNDLPYKGIALERFRDMLEYLPRFSTVLLSGKPGTGKTSLIKSAYPLANTLIVSNKVFASSSKDCLYDLITATLADVVIIDDISEIAKDELGLKLDFFDALEDVVGELYDKLGKHLTIFMTCNNPENIPDNFKRAGRITLHMDYDAFIASDPEFFEDTLSFLLKSYDVSTEDMLRFFPKERVDILREINTNYAIAYIIQLIDRIISHDGLFIIQPWDVHWRELDKSMVERFNRISNDLRHQS